MIMQRSIYVYLLLSLLPLFIKVGRTDTLHQKPEPPQAPTRTGKSYSGGDPVKRPAPVVPQSPSPLTFTDITARSGITFRHANSPTSQKYLLETMGSGVAVFDYNNDGRMDLYFTNGAELDDPMPKTALPDKRDARFWNRLYKQRADGTFEDVTERAGGRGEGYSMGVATGDYDNDGWVDLYVTAYGGNILYRNRGDGTFEDVTSHAGVGAGGWSTSAGFFDYDRDGRLDLFVTRYLEWDFAVGSIYCGEQRSGFRAYCHPDNFKGIRNILYRQRPDGTFEDTTAQARIDDFEGKGLGVAFADFDGDGWTDVFVANDSVRQSLYHNQKNGTFENVALLSGVGYDEDGKPFAGMGVDAADYDNDGLPDVFITTLSNETYPLYHNNGDMSFTYVTRRLGVGQITLLYSGWGTRFIDVDRDGWRDVFVAQGHVLDTVEKTSSYLTYKQPALLMLNTSKAFVNISAGAGPAFSMPLAARGAAFGDLDNDGDMDVVLTTIGGPPIILRNDATKNHWVGLTLIGTKSNRQGIGARLVIDQGLRKQYVELSTASSYLSAQDPRVLVGLGASADAPEVEIRWPSGQVQRVPGIAVDRYHTIREP
jgi:hypothetical protein